VGGAELNVAVAAARLGLRSCWVSRLPDNPLGRLIRNKAREQGVATEHILWSTTDRCGLYFFEFGATPRPSAVLYDRAHSAISKIQPGEVNWEAIFTQAKHFHTSGITPALSPSCAEVTAEALKAAQAADCSVSYDLNYRGKLWTEEEARRCQEPLMEYVDILITTEEDTARVFKITAEEAPSDETFREVAAETYKQVAVKLQEKFGFKIVAITLREMLSVWKNTWTAIVYSEGQFYEDLKREVDIVDRLGAGDSFSAGFLYGYLSGWDLGEALRFGNAFSALKHSVPGDLNWINPEEVEALLKGEGLRVRR